MKLIYAQGFTNNERLEWKPVIFNNVVQAFKMIHDAMTELGIKFEDPENEVGYNIPLGASLVGSSHSLLVQTLDWAHKLTLWPASN